jgi:2-C-methyl-D-erythritol 4-phosphate cytidylyltransferase
VNSIEQEFVVIVPAAGVGKRMLANCPKQYLCINNETILTLTVERLLSHRLISTVILALSEDDEYFASTPLVNNPNVHRVSGGAERVDSVLSGLQKVDEAKFPWVLVHDAARPCITHHDIDQLIAKCLADNSGGLLAAPVVDTMKQSQENSLTPKVSVTVDRSLLWHALTPQMYKTNELIVAIEQAQHNGVNITDESSAIEQANLPSLLVSGSRENIKITRPEDLALAAFYLNQQKLTNKESSCV